MDRMSPPSRRGSSIEVGTRRDEQSIDDWLGDLSDDDWNEQSPVRSEARRDRPTRSERSARARGSVGPGADAAEPPRVAEAAGARRAAVERRRLVAVLVLAALLGLAVVIPLMLLRGDDSAPVTGPTATESTPPPSPPATTPPPSPTAPSTTTPTAQGFVLPEGTKLQRGEGDPALVRELQRALSGLGYDPGPADGTFGRRTEAAVVAFQQDNGLAVDGRVGPETGAALSRALVSD